MAFRPFRLPPDFDVRDHPARVRALGDAFVARVVRSLDAYRASVTYVARRFDRRDRHVLIDY